jgi:hypothetical protein
MKNAASIPWEDQSGMCFMTVDLNITPDSAGIKRGIPVPEAQKRAIQTAVMRRTVSVFQPRQVKESPPKLPTFFNPAPSNWHKQPLLRSSLIRNTSYLETALASTARMPGISRGTGDSRAFAFAR